MNLDIYWITLLTLLPAVALLIGRDLVIKPLARALEQWRWDGIVGNGQLQSEEETELTGSLLNNTDAATASPSQQQDEATRLCRTFISIYLLVMSSEWLSGPYLYTLLRDDRALAEPIVCALYATAYTSAAVSALVVGFLADRFGRRRACLTQCAVHAAACLATILGGTYLPVLFLGRILAGVGLTLLWTVFESWMVTEWNARGLEDRCGGGGMSRMFGMMTTANCMTAIVGGVLGYCMVSVTGSKVWPFWTGIILEAVAAVLMLRNMNENYGVNHEEREQGTSSTPDTTGRRYLGDGRVWALTFVTCCFEGTGFLVIFFWPSVLQDAHNLTHGAISGDVPYGVIFASFMAAMIIGALIFNALSGVYTFQPGSNKNDSDTYPSPSPSSATAARTPVCLLIGAVVLAGVGLSWLSMLRAEAAQFGTFLVFEVANGVYVPSMAHLRGVVVDDRSRAGLYGLMKIPLFVFVILALGITAEDNRSRRFIFVSASCCLLLAVLALVWGFRETIKPPKDVQVDVQDGDEMVPADVDCVLSRQLPDMYVKEPKDGGI